MVKQITSYGKPLKSGDRDGFIGKKLRILQALVGDFIRSAEPIGSRTLIQKSLIWESALPPSRNEMSDLEEMGFFDASAYFSGQSSLR